MWLVRATAPQSIFTQRSSRPVHNQTEVPKLKSQGHAALIRRSWFIANIGQAFIPVVMATPPIFRYVSTQADCHDAPSCCFAIVP